MVRAIQQIGELAEYWKKYEKASQDGQCLLAVGADPRSAVPRGVKMLTATEKRVAALAAAGRAEREIAQELFVTPRTIEVKLGSALRKLGASSHSELALALET